MTVATASPIETALEGVLSSLGTPTEDLHKEALQAYENGDAAKLRRLAASNLADNFCRSLGYAVSAKLKPELPTVAVVLAEAARAAADFTRDREMQRLSQVIAEALS